MKNSEKRWTNKDHLEPKINAGPPEKYKASQIDFSKPPPVESNATRLPNSVKKMYGCLNCEWKGTSFCPFAFTKSKEVTPQGICPHRTNFLLSLCHGYLKKRHKNTDNIGTLHEFRRIFNLAIGDVKQRKDYHKLQMLEKEIEKIDKKVPGNQGDFMELETQRRKIREEWQSLWKEMVTVDEKIKDRSTPKKLEMKKDETITIRNIQQIMREGEEPITISEKKKKKETNEEEELYGY